MPKVPRSELFETEKHWKISPQEKRLTVGHRRLVSLDRVRLMRPMADPAVDMLEEEEEEALNIIEASSLVPGPLVPLCQRVLSAQQVRL